jgi:glycerophosphoryl diester phosphodiesterase
VPFVIHDPDLTRLAGIRRAISSTTSSELKKIKVGKKYTRFFGGFHIPTLVEAVAFCEKHRLALNVELKETVSQRPELIRFIIDIVSSMEDIHFSSFDYHSLEHVKKENPQMETALLLRKKSVDWDRLEQYHFADGFHFHKRLLKEPYLSYLIASKKKIRIYGMTGKEPIVVNPPAFINGWITDYPDRFMNMEKDQDD